MSDQKANLMLKWHEEKGEFVPIESEEDMDEGVFIELIEDEKKWRDFYIK